jgi:hypothetical protein
MSIDHQYKYLAIVQSPALQKGKTKYWIVYSKDENTALGVIRWYGAWRCYAFFPEPSTLFEKNCLWDIADFVAKETAALRETWKKRKPCPALMSNS